MDDCMDCMDLRGRATRWGPHQGLARDAVTHRSNGELEQYKCVVCGAHWERFKPAAAYTAKKYFWLELKPVS